MSSDIDLESIQREFVQALNAEKKYERENDAKFRAVNQRVATYEEFRDIVKASHLQPLDRKEIVGGPRKQPWNPAAIAGTKTVDGPTGKEDLLKGCGLPTTAQELVRQWRKVKGNQQRQYELLLSLVEEHRLKILRSEVSTSLLGEILTVLNNCFTAADSTSILEVLETLADTPRFKLSIALLSRNERDSIKELLEHLSTSENSAVLSDLQQLYLIT